MVAARKRLKTIQNNGVPQIILDTALQSRCHNLQRTIHLLCPQNEIMSHCCFIEQKRYIIPILFWKISKLKDVEHVSK